MEIKAESRTRKRMAAFLKAFAAWAQKNAFSVFPVPAGCGCCFEQLRQTGADIVSNPHHADVLLVGGALSRKAASTVRRLYDQMPEPKYVVAWGGCAASGGLFSGSYATADVADILPVDVYIPGCPPDAAAIEKGMTALRKVVLMKIEGKTA